ncbi:MAG: kynureninase [Proteobacteria bacterium]|nr:kynureninase [Pseudomonadota bacterium]
MSLNDVRELDRRDPLRLKRADFALPPGTIYLDGNSLGALPANVATRLVEVAQTQWGGDLITSWNKHNWIDMPVQIGEKIAPLIGAAPGQVVVCDTISVNLFKLLTFALALQPGRTTILSQADNFPTDLYIAQGLEQTLTSSRCKLVSVAESDLTDGLTDEVAVLLLTHVNFRSGAFHDMQKLTDLAHRKGVLVLWDLAHSAGAMPIHLDACHVDFAVGCGYKYLNGGPGAPAFVYVATRHQNAAVQPLTGWMGHADPFAFDSAYLPAPGILKFLCGTPSVLAMCALDEALNVFNAVDLQQVRKKSEALGDLCRTLFATRVDLAEFQLVSPIEAHNRASQIAYTHPHAYQICQALITENTITDFRAPDILRIGFTPLYTRYEDVWMFVEQITRIVSTRVYLDPKYSIRAKVT